MADKVKLCCPHCGNQQLYSEEDTIVLFPVYVSDDGDGGSDIEYGPDFGETVYMDEGTVSKDVLWCRGGCGSQLTFEELLTPRKFAHIASPTCRIEESSDRGSGVRWQAVCAAAESGYECGWESRWFVADNFVGAATEVNRSRPKTNFMDPGGLAYEAAEEAGVEHMKSEGVAPPGE